VPELELLDGVVAVAKLAPKAVLPGWASTQTAGPLHVIVRTADETSIVCDDDVVPADVPALRKLRVLRLATPPAPDAVGVIAAITSELADRGVWVLALGTHDTDYVLVRESELDRVPLA
jgi:hypothetical protein